VSHAGDAIDAHLAWRVLETGGKVFAGQYRVIESGLVISQGPVLFAIDSQGVRLVLFPIEMDATVDEDRHSAGVQLHSRTLSDEGSEHRYVSLVCMKTRLTDVFTALVGDVLTRLSAHSERPDLICGEVLTEWRELLARELGRGLSYEARVGLFGELWTLRQLIQLTPTALRAWVGPDGARHDFMAADVSLETKTSAVRRGRFAGIHGVEQLQAFPDSRLYLVFIRVEHVPAGGQTISEIARDIVGLGADRLELFERLARLGCDGGQDDLPADDRFRVTEERFYAVEESFPRITTESFHHNHVPAGVTGLSYEIDLTNEPPYPLDRGEVSALQSRLAHGRSLQL